MKKTVKPINLFSTPTKLAKILALAPEHYNHANTLLRILAIEGIAHPHVKAGLEQTIKTLEEAQAKAQQKTFYLFSEYDSWAEEQEGRGEGYGIYCLINNQLVDVSPYKQRPFTLEGVIKGLQQRKVTTLYTFPFEDTTEAYGLQQKTVDEDEDIIERKEAEEGIEKRLQQANIRLVRLEAPLRTRQ